MNLLLRIIFVLPLTILSNGVYAQSPDLQDVLERMIDAYGGEQNLHKLNNAIQEWGFFAPAENRHGVDVRSIRIPGQLKVELAYSDKTEMRILQGETAYVIFDGRPAQPAGQAQRDAMQLQLMRLYSPLVLRAKSDALTLAIEGGLCALSLQENGLRTDYLVNQETWRIEKVVGTLTVNGTEMRFLTEYSDFKIVDETLVHQTENKFAGGVNTAKLQLRQITFDAGLGDGDFKPR